MGFFSLVSPLPPITSLYPLFESPQFALKLRTERISSHSPKSSQFILLPISPSSLSSIGDLYMDKLTVRGYDFGYLLKILTAEPLPNQEQAFFDALLVWFPNIYDIKHIVRSVKTLRGGLQEIAESIGVSQCSYVLLREKRLVCWGAQDIEQEI
jgi:hypothetical protein